MDFVGNMWSMLTMRVLTEVVWTCTEEKMMGILGEGC